MIKYILWIKLIVVILALRFINIKCILNIFDYALILNIILLKLNNQKYNFKPCLRFASTLEEFIDLNFY